ncbi:unnamed protein product [Staurois parvus]|uniref:Uncharacterized protein n=1 Tax=Staurois parvus TaxID=386267 RepID=A0ABN9BBH2_9NEOB|nr:unnamed protein product [Staurois parvus]
MVSSPLHVDYIPLSVRKTRHIPKDLLGCCNIRGVTCFLYKAP